MDMATTVGVLNGLAAAVRTRRTMIPEPGPEAAGPESTGRSRAGASA
jgi:hypothetical protein